MAAAEVGIGLVTVAAAGLEILPIHPQTQDTNYSNC